MEEHTTTYRMLLPEILILNLIQSQDATNILLETGNRGTCETAPRECLQQNSDHRKLQNKLLVLLIK